MEFWIWGWGWGIFGYLGFLGVFGGFLGSLGLYVQYKRLFRPFFPVLDRLMARGNMVTIEKTHPAPDGRGFEMSSDAVPLGVA